MEETIRRVNGYDHDAYTYYPVIIIGAGASGVAMACQLKEKLGFDQFRVFDRQAGIGGTWWINRYPGVACDVPAVFYSFSFAQNPNWTSFHPPGREIVQYYHEVCQKYKVTDKFELNTDVEQCRWLEDEQLWEVTLRRMVAGMGDLSYKDRAIIAKEKGESAVYSETEVVRCKVLVSGVGGLVEPKGWPNEIPGIEGFKGPVFHSARWDDNVDFTDKNVVVVGTGCSSAQLVPRLPNAPWNAKSVTQLMRSAPWVCPAADAPGGDEWWEKNGPRYMNVPGLRQSLRFMLFLAMEKAWFDYFPDNEKTAKKRKIYEQTLLARVKRIVPEKYHEILTPNYGVGCKRRIFDKRWLKSLNDPKVELTTQPLVRVTENSAVLGEGLVYPPDTKQHPPEREVPADIIVLANGFDTTKWLHPVRIAGRGGKDLVEEMDERGGPQAYQGTALDGFPNFFMIFGPNTATGHSSAVMAIENMIMYSLNFIKPLLKGEASIVEVKHEAEVAYTDNLQKVLKTTVWGSAGGCWSWYVNDGWNSAGYPYSQFDFYRRCKFPKWSDWDITYTKKGVVRNRSRQATKLLVIAFAVFGAYRMRQSGLTWADGRSLVQKVLYDSVQRLQGGLAVLRNQIHT